MTQQLLDEVTLALPFALNLQSVHLNEETFERLCNDNPDLKLELTAKGELVIMPSTGYESGWRNSILDRRVGNWAEQKRSGKVFDSSTAFTLPSGAKRSPDVSWISDERIEALPVEKRKGFARIVPDFVIELRSPSDSLEELKDKMVEYIDNDVRLGWLIDPLEKRVHIYRPEREPEILSDPETILGEDVLEGFVLNVREVW
jgi:Uma2 family endonuclease